jgi:hypothetical protein
MRHNLTRSADTARFARVAILSVVAALTMAGRADAQSASFVLRLGRDTIAVEQYTRTANRMTGEVASRAGAAVTRLQYDVALGNDGRATSVTYRQRNAAGAPLPNQPTEVRIAFVGDSARREAVFADSVSTRTVAAARGTPFQSPAFGLLEIAFVQLRRGNEPNLQFGAVNLAGNPAQLTLTAAGGDTVRASTGFVYRVDREGRLLSVDGTATTQKFISTRGTAAIDVAAVAGRMTPAGTLSPRGAAHGSFMQSVVFISYGRPQVRERTVWGGVLVPFDAIWRTGANEATHLATSRELAFGDLVVPPGLYTLYIYNAQSGPQLAINRQVGQWGTVYDQAQDLGRVPLTMSNTPEHVEEFTITIRSLGGGGRGAIDFAWGPQMATATFTAR